MVESSGVSSYGNDFKDFIVKNGVITAAIAITIGVSTAGFIKAFVSNVLMPLVYLVIGKLFLEKINGRAFNSLTEVFGPKANLDVLAFIQEFVTWVFVVIGAYIIIEFFVRRWFLGISPAAKQAQAHAPAPSFSLGPAPPVYVTSVNATPPLSYLGLGLGGSS